jgi:hypothetical protein
MQGMYVIALTIAKALEYGRPPSTCFFIAIQGALRDVSQQAPVSQPYL